MYNLTVILLHLFFIPFLRGDFGYHGHGHNDGEYGLRVCPPWSRQDYCDLKRDILWQLKIHGNLWGNRCRDNLQGINQRVCGAVLKGSFNTCHNGNVSLLAIICNRDCQALHGDLNGDCTFGNSPRERCICYYNRRKH